MAAFRAAERWFGGGPKSRIHRWGTLLSGAGGGVALSCRPCQSQCAATPTSPHLAFEWTARSFSVHGGGAPSVLPSRNTDCPICKKYGTGPCGSLFWSWWDCTEANETDHVAACAQEFERFRVCRDQTEVDSMDADKQEGSAHAWQAFLREELAQFPRREFPEELEPKLEQSRKFVGEISLVEETADGLSLLATIVQQGGGDESNAIAGASVMDMLPRSRNRKSMAFLLPRQESKTVNIVAAYEKEDGSVHVFETQVTLR